MRMRIIIVYLLSAVVLSCCACGKSSQPTPVTPVGPPSFSFSALKVNGVYNGFTYKGINNSPAIALSFSSPLNHTSVASAVAFSSSTGTNVSYTVAYQNKDSTIIITPKLQALTQY